MTEDNSNVAELGIVLDLDLEERPREEVKPPCKIKVKGRTITFEDPANLDWRDLALMDNPMQFLRLSLSAEDAKFIRETELEAWKFNKLMEAYYAHYDLEGKIREAQRQQQFG